MSTNTRRLKRKRADDGIGDVDLVITHVIPLFISFLVVISLSLSCFDRENTTANFETRRPAANKDHDESKMIVQELGYLFSLQCFESILLPILVPYAVAFAIFFLVMVVTGTSDSFTFTEIIYKAFNHLVEWIGFVGCTMVVLAIVFSYQVEQR